MTTSLTINDVRLWVHLGANVQEQTHVQAVSISIQLDFATAPLAMATDHLTDTFCYATAIDHIQQRLAQLPPFHLIEHLTACVYAILYHDLLSLSYQDVTLDVSVTKLTPPVPNLLAGVTFRCRGSLREGRLDPYYQHWFP